MSRKVLIITYYWPPSGGAGVQRWVKFAKYLPEFGWEPVILTIEPEYAAYPVIDNSLASEVPGSIKIFKTKARDYFRVYNRDRSKIPSAGFAVNQDDSFRGKFLRFVRGNFFIPDPRKGWNKYAFRKACEIIEKEDIKYIITTSPPHSTQLIGLKIRQKYPEIKWIADLRDPWTDIYYYDLFYPTPFSRKIDAGYEKQVLQMADSIITVGDSLRRLFITKVPGAESKTNVISNGFDEEDFTGETIRSEKFIITYTGTLSDIYPIGRFLDALGTLKEQDFTLRFVGSVSPGQRDLVLSKIKPDKVQFHNYAPHKDAIRYMRESTALLLIIPDHMTSRSILTGKLFEYIAAGVPVICLGPVDGDAASILDRTGHGKTFSHYDDSSISSYLGYLASDPNISLTAPEGFSRKELTGKLASILNSKQE